jgi:hypothetical protein
MTSKTMGFRRATGAHASGTGSRKLRRGGCAALFGAALLACSSAWGSAAAGYVITETVNADGLAPATTGVNFGKSVGVDVHYGPNTVRALYVGAPDANVDYLDNIYTHAGAVYIYTPHDGHWQFSSRIHATPPQANAHFGAAVAVQNGIIVVGEPDRNDNGHPGAGMLWFFGDYYSDSPTMTEPVISTFGERSVAFDNAHLGSSVAVSGAGNVLGGGGTWLAGGAPGLQGVGCVYLSRLTDQPYTNGSYSEVTSTCGAASGDAFGASVALLSLGSTQVDVVVGAPGVAQGDQAAAGAAYVYILNNGGLLDVGDLHADTPHLIDSFGTSVAIDTHRVYVGATGRDNGSGRTGSVSLFNPAFIIGYDFDTEVFPGDGAMPGDLCGASIYLDSATDNGFITGCPGSDGTLVNEGAARIFRQYEFLNTLIWLDDRLVWGGKAHGVDDLGRGVAMVANRAFVGAPNADDAVGVDNGAVEVFEPDSIFHNGFN